MPPAPHSVRTRWTRLALLAGLLLSAGGYYFSHLNKQAENLRTSIQTALHAKVRASSQTVEMLERIRASSEVKEVVATLMKPSLPRTQEQKEEFEAVFRMTLAKRYEDLLSNLDLSDSDMEAFREFLVTRQLLIQIAVDQIDPELRRFAMVRFPAERDPKSNTMIQANVGVPVGDQTAVRVALVAVTALADDSIRPLLGEENFEKYKFYQDTNIFRGVVDHLDVSVSNALNSAQTDQLLGLLAASNPSYYLEPTRPMVNADVLDKASDFLTPAQLAALRNTAEKQARDAALISEALSKLEN